MKKIGKMVITILVLTALGFGLYKGYQYIDKQNEVPHEESPLPPLDEINEAKEMARRMSVKNYAVAVMSAYELYFMNHGVAPTNFSEYQDLVFYSGDVVECEGINYDAGKIMMKNCKVQDKMYDYQEGKVVLK